MSVETAQAPVADSQVGLPSEENHQNASELSVANIPEKQESRESEKVLQEEMIPEELLFALTQSEFCGNQDSKEQLAPVKKNKTPDKLRMALKRGPPANVWHHKGRRTQFKHLTDNPRSLGKGVGTRDISFLYDVTTHQKPRPPAPSKLDKSAVRLDAAQQAGKLAAAGSQLAVPDSIIPEEYHIVKSKAVLGLEYIDESLTTKISDHDQILRVFPSLLPTKRFEVVQLLRTLDALLEKSGVDDEEIEIKGPSQIHNLLELIKKEQNIYDLVFAEVIRQVSVECVERGQLLSKLRQKYADLLNRVPRQIKSLHAEVMAQRSLDRRLTEELLRFKSSISFLTTELQNVREHDQQVTQDAATAEVELAQALKESQTNANLVDEYHDLYEMQRKRLETSVQTLNEEKDLWSSAAYDLSLKVMSVNSLNTAKRLHVSEKAWSKLANHFTVLLSDRDSENLAQMQKHVSTWRELIFHFNQTLESADKKTTNTLTKVKEGLERWTDVFDDSLAASMSDVRSFKIPPKETIQKLYDEVKHWEEILGEDSERFGGGMLLNNQEQLNKMSRETEAWTEIGLIVYRRHKKDGESFPLSETMIQLNSKLHDMLKQLDIRTSGENGVARGMISLQNNLGSWVNKLIMMVHGSESFSDSEWLHLYEKIGDYKAVVEEALENIGSQQKDEDKQNKLDHKRIEVVDMMQEVQDWMKTTLNQIEAEDGKLMVQVNTIHTDMVQWMVQTLLHLAPNHLTSTPTTPSEASMSAWCTLEKLETRGKTITDHLSHFTNYTCQCAGSIVLQTMQEKKDMGEDDAEHEYRDFSRVKREAKEWIHTCEILLNALLPEPVRLLTSDVNKLLAVRDDVTGEESPSTPASRPVTQEGSEAPLKDSKDGGKAALLSVDAAQIKATPAPTTPAAQSSVSPPLTESEEKKEQPVAIETIAGRTPDAKKAAEQTTTEVKSATSSTSELPTRMEVIGTDENVQSSSILPPDSGAVTTSVSRELTPPSSKLTQSAYDAIAQMDQVHDQLLSTEQRAQDAEQKALDLEEELNSANEKIRALEKKVSKMEEVVGSPGSPAAQQATPADKQPDLVS
uniref:Axonemal dynein light chain domain-containing protein 1-like n=1 Tax=Phallusia mammillata TaxID=59560 RepID=A0A6F9D6J9_9ASCI|nr:axonemal dynein light chain domain-containing protein 1-like [Phallusia mammillata]